jgi:FkbH-like protein
MQRDYVMETFSGDYESFLRSCEMKMRIFIPREEKHVLRCLELIQRSNQLNLSMQRYTSEEFRQLRANPEIFCVALECEDKFGKYGLVGFASVSEGAEKPVIKDFVLSCRVAQKRVEHTFINWLALREAGRGCIALQANIFRTAKNKPLFQVFEDLPFDVIKEENGNILMEMSLDKKIETNDIISLEVAID